MFGNKKGHKNTVADCRNGVLVCSNCRKKVPFGAHTPLTLVQCELCGNGYNFIPQRIDQFWLFRPLGGGGMGSVYEALVESDESQTAAIKVLPRNKTNDPVLIAGLQSEIVIMQNLGSHPCIVSMLGSGVENNEYYVAMQCIHGERLDKRIERLHKLPELEVIMIALRILQGETHIYNQGYLFRDMKPENVIVNDEGAFLFDYGICMRVEDAYEDMGDTVSGSPIYWPPERVMGEVEMPRSEIYSIGMVLYHCLNGEPYFQAKEIDAMARKHVRSVRLNDFEQKMKRIKPDFAHIITKMIARAPEDRYQSFAEVEYELTKLLETRLTPGGN